MKYHVPSLQIDEPEDRLHRTANIFQLQCKAIANGTIGALLLCKIMKTNLFVQCQFAYKINASHTAIPSMP